MSTTIDESFIREYVADVHEVFQRMGGYLRPTVRMKTGVQGKSTTFQKVGKGTATTKARHGEITPMNQDHTPIQCFLEDFYAGDYVDMLDEAKININERMVIAQGGAWALGRKVDDLIIDELDNTTQSAVSWTLTDSETVRNSLLEQAEALFDNDVPNDGQVFGLLTSRAWSQAMTIEEFSSADYIGPEDLPFNNGFISGGRMKDWMGVKWMRHTGLPGAGTASAKVFIYHKTAIGFGAGRHASNKAENDEVAADIQWIGPRAAHWVNHWMSGGAKLIDDTGVIEGSVDDTAAIVKSP